MAEHVDLNPSPGTPYAGLPDPGVQLTRQQETSDVVIAGAGPAGTVAATLLARAGLRVRLVDRARFPRDKLCGDSVNPGALDLLRRLRLAREIEQRGLPIDGMHVFGPAGAHVTATYPDPLHGLTVMRRDLDQWLLDGAIAAGAQFEEGVTVRGPLLNDKQVAGVLIKSAAFGEIPLAARVTIAADGRRSTLAFGMGLAAHPSRPRRWAVGAYFERVTGMSSMGEMHIRPGKYVGVAPLANGWTNVCVVGTPASLKHLNDPQRVLRAALDEDPTLRERLAGARQVTRPVVLGPLAVDSRVAGAPGLLLAGDAAGFIDPMTGDGMRLAVQGAELAAEAALEMLETGNTHMHVTLAHRRRMVFASKPRFNRALRWLVDSPAALRVAALGASIAPAYIQSLVAFAGDCGTLLEGNLSNAADDCRDLDRGAAAHPHPR